MSRPFEELITSWLRTVLHFNPKMRGGRRTTTQDAPCLINMDDILQTKVRNGSVATETPCTVGVGIDKVIGSRQVTRWKAKSGAVVKHQRKLVVLKTTSNVKGHFKSSFAPHYRSLVTFLSSR